MGTAIAVGVIVAIIAGFVVWLSVSNRNAGADSQRAGDLKVIDDTQDKQLDAANQSRDPADIADKLRKHEF